MDEVGLGAEEKSCEGGEVARSWVGGTKDELRESQRGLPLPDADIVVAVLVSATWEHHRHGTFDEVPAMTDL